MHFQRFVSEELAQYSYLIGEAGRAIVIDPRRDVDVYLTAAATAGLRISAIVETHRHEDFVVGSAALGERTGASVWHADSQLSYEYGEPARDGQTWALGSLTLEAMQTPGHTLGSMSYLLRTAGGTPWMAFTGDLLFAGDVGRVDFYGEDRMAEMAGHLYGALQRRILPLGDGLVLWPAHGAGSACGATLADRDLITLGLERSLNPQLQVTSRDAFIERVARPLPFPPYFHGVEENNLSGAEACPTPYPLAPLAPGDLDGASMQLVDLRDELAFASAHLPGAINLPPGTLGRFAGWLVRPENPVALVGPAGPDAAVSLCRMGYDHLLGELGGGIEAYLRSGREPARTRTISVQTLCRALDAGEQPWILDVRSDDECAASAIPGAQGIDLRYLPSRADEVPEDREVFVFCGSGRRAMVATSALQQRGGSDNVVVVLGGFAGWQARTCPIQRA